MELFFDFLPKYQQEIIKKLADVYQINSDYAVSSFFSVAAAALGDRYKVIDPKEHVNATALWLCLVAISGYGKTDVLKWLMRYLLRRDTSRRADYKKQYSAWQKADPQERGEAPIQQKLVFNDYTPESLFAAMETAGANGVLLYRDELEGWLKDIGRYGKSGEVEQYLTAWSQGYIDVDRVQRLGSSVERPCFSIVGGIQPDVLREHLGQPELLSNGFSARFLFVWQDDKFPLKYVKESMPDSLRAAYDSLIERLLNIEHNEVRFSPEAEKSYIAYWEDLQLRKSTEGGMMRPLLSKLQIYVEKWAGLIEILVRDGQPVKEITGLNMQIAIEHMKAFESWAVKVYKLICPERMNLSVPRPLLNKQETLEQLLRNYPNMNKAQVAEGLKINRSALSRLAGKATPLQRNTQQAENIVVSHCYPDNSPPS